MKGQIEKVESNQHYKNELNEANASMVEVRMEKCNRHQIWERDTEE